MAEVVELSLADHRQAHHGYLHLVCLEGYIIAVEVTAVIDVLRDGIDDGVVGSSIQFLVDNIPADA